MADNSQENREKLLALVNAAIEEEKSLREKYQIGDKFRFIRDKLSALQMSIVEGLNEIKATESAGPDVLAADEVLVYVYIFNSQGQSAASWQKLLHQSVFYEYSVNRPIYADQSYIDSFIRSRPNKVQHGYLTVAIKKSDVLPVLAGSPVLKDVNNNPLIKIREGSLKFNRVISFKYNEGEYTVKESGEMVKKTSSN